MYGGRFVASLEDAAFFLAGIVGSFLVGWYTSLYFYKKTKDETAREKFEREISAPTRVFLEAAKAAAQKYEPVPENQLKRIQRVRETAAERYPESEALFSNLDRRLDEYHKSLGDMKDAVDTFISAYPRTAPPTNVLGRRIRAQDGNLRRISDILFDLHSYEVDQYPLDWLSAALTLFKLRGVFKLGSGTSASGIGRTVNVDGVPTIVPQSVLDEADKLYSKLRGRFNAVFEPDKRRDSLVEELDSIREGIGNPKLSDQR